MPNPRASGSSVTTRPRAGAPADGPSRSSLGIDDDLAGRPEAVEQVLGDIVFDLVVLKVVYPTFILPASKGRLDEEGMAAVREFLRAWEGFIAEPLTLLETPERGFEAFTLADRLEQDSNTDAFKRFARLLIYACHIQDRAVLATVLRDIAQDRESTDVVKGDLEGARGQYEDFERRGMVAAFMSHLQEQRSDLPPRALAALAASPLATSKYGIRHLQAFAEQFDDKFLAELQHPRQLSRIERIDAGVRKAIPTLLSRIAKAYPPVRTHELADRIVNAFDAETISTQGESVVASTLGKTGDGRGIVDGIEQACSAYLEQTGKQEHRRTRTGLSKAIAQSVSAVLDRVGERSEAGEALRADLQGRVQRAVFAAFPAGDQELIDRLATPDFESEAMRAVPSWNNALAVYKMLEQRHQTAKKTGATAQPTGATQISRLRFRFGEGVWMGILAKGPEFVETVLLFSRHVDGQHQNNPYRTLRELRHDARAERLANSTVMAVDIDIAREVFNSTNDRKEYIERGLRKSDQQLQGRVHELLVDMETVMTTRRLSGGHQRGLREARGDLMGFLSQNLLRGIDQVCQEREPDEPFAEFVQRLERTRPRETGGLGGYMRFLERYHLLMLVAEDHVQAEGGRLVRRSAAVQKRSGLRMIDKIAALRERLRYAIRQWYFTDQEPTRWESMGQILACQLMAFIVEGEIPIAERPAFSLSLERPVDRPAGEAEGGEDPILRAANLLQESLKARGG